MSNAYRLSRSLSCVFSIPPVIFWGSTSIGPQSLTFKLFPIHETPVSLHEPG
jgi:hypothetical protein